MLAVAGLALAQSPGQGGRSGGLLPTRETPSISGGTTREELLRRFDLDANGRIEHVDGDGVIGEQPRLRPGEDFRYTSGVMLETEHGTMQGHYDMVADDGTEFAAAIAPFVLTVPRTLH